MRLLGTVDDPLSRRDVNEQTKSDRREGFSLKSGFCLSRTVGHKILPYSVLIAGQLHDFSIIASNDPLRR